MNVFSDDKHNSRANSISTLTRHHQYFTRLFDGTFSCLIEIPNVLQTVVNDSDSWKTSDELAGGFNEESERKDSLRQRDDETVWGRTMTMTLWNETPRTRRTARITAIATLLWFLCMQTTLIGVLPSTPTTRISLKGTLAFRSLLIETNESQEDNQPATELIRRSDFIFADDRKSFTETFLNLDRIFEEKFLIEKFACNFQCYKINLPV